MKEFQVKNFEMSAKRPSLNSVIEQRKRLAQQQVEQDALLQQDTYTETEAKLMQEASSMSVVDHLSELRTRLVIAIVAIIIGTLGAYYYVEDILQILVAPAGKLYYTKPTEAFFTYMKISLVAGCIVSSPVWFYQIWAFIALGVLGILSSDRLREYRKMFILLAFIIGAAISPTPDMLSQTMIAGPMILLYEISYGVLRYIVKV